MEFTIKCKTSNNEITLSKEVVNEIISILDKVDCTAVWSEYDQSYIKVKDVPEELVDSLIMKMKLVG